MYNYCISYRDVSCMHKSKSVFLILLSLIMLLSACGTPAPVEITEPVIVETEPTIAPTEKETIPEETLPPAMEITDFVLDTIDGVNYYTMNGFSYPAFLGEPELGMEGVAALYQAGNAEAAAKNINNIADAIHYVAQMAPFTDSRAACEAFVKLTEDDRYNNGYISLQGDGFTYNLAYVENGNTYYPIDVFAVVTGFSSWTMLPENRCAPSEDAYALCENIANTYPDNTVRGWVMEPSEPLAAYEAPSKYPYPWQLSGAELGPEKVKQLLDAGDLYAAQQAITTVEDAITYLLMMNPDTRDPHPMKGIPAWKTFLYLVADDYEDVGLIYLMKRKPEHREGFYDESAYFDGYYICYVKNDGVYYPVDYLNILGNWTSWTLMPGSGCDSSENLDDLCEHMGATFPHHSDGSKLYYWEITSYMYHQGTKLIPVNEFIIPEALGHPVLSDEEIEALVQETDYEKIAMKITTLADALHFYNKLRLVFPRGRYIIDQDSLRYPPSAWQVLKDKTAFGGAVGNVTRYLLKEDYDEIGYVLARTNTMDSTLTYIYDDGLYYLLYTATYPTEPREDLWIEWPEMIGCAEDFQTIADSAIEHMCFYSPQYYEKVREIYLIRCEGDMVYKSDPQGCIFPVGTEVTAYYGPQPRYVETTLDWQSQTRIDK